MPKPERLNLDTLIENIHHFNGKMEPIALSMEAAESTVYNYRNKYKSVDRAFKEAQEAFYCNLLDMAEHGLQDAVEEGMAWAVRFALDTQGNRRGFNQKQQIEHSSQSTAFKLVVIES